MVLVLDLPILPPTTLAIYSLPDSLPLILSQCPLFKFSRQKLTTSRVFFGGSLSRNSKRRLPQTCFYDKGRVSDYGPKKDPPEVRSRPKHLPGTHYLLLPQHRPHLASWTRVSFLFWNSAPVKTVRSSFWHFIEIPLSLAGS